MVAGAICLAYDGAIDILSALALLSALLAISPCEFGLLGGTVSLSTSIKVVARMLISHKHLNEKPPYKYCATSYLSEPA